MSFAANYDPMVYKEPEALYASWTALATEPPTFTTRINPLVVGAKPDVPTLLISRHADVERVLKEPKLFPAPQRLLPPLPRPSPEVRQALPAWPWEPPMLFGTEPWTATPIRRVVAQSWTRPRLEHRRGEMLATAQATLEPLLPQGRCDLVGDFSRPFVMRSLVTDILGLPMAMCEIADALAADQQRLFMHAIGLTALGDAELLEISQRQLEQRNAFLAEIDRQQAQAMPGLISDLLHARLDAGVVATPMQALSVVYHVLLAVDNPVLFIGVALDFLTKHPEQMATLCAQPSQIPHLVEEALRLRPPLPILQTRLATGDTEIGNIHVPKGTLIALHIGAANRDPQVFDVPATFDQTRSAIGESLTFSGGAHRCLAPWLGRMLVQCGVEAILQAVPQIRRTAEPPVPYPGLQDGFERIDFSWAVCTAA